MKKLVIPILIVIAVFFQHCKKESDNFSYCTGCPISSWVGFYSGSGTYFTANTGETTDGVEVTVSITNNYNSNLVVNVEAPGYISESFSKSKTDEYHYILMGSGSRILDIGLKKKGNEYKLDGTLKRNSWNKIDSVWVVDRSLTFQVNKTAP